MIPRLMAVFLIVFFAAIPAMSQPGSIGVFADPSATDYGLYDSAPGLMLVYIVHVSTPGATGAQFAVPHPWCLGATYLSEAVTPPYIKIGTCAGPGATGCEIAYAGCRTSPNMILTVQYFAQGTTPNCCCLYVIPDANANPQEILVTDCSDPPQLQYATSSLAIVNPAEGCMPDMCGSVTCLNAKPVPVEDTSWGAIKMLYSN
jgi:hypothetical protein